MGALPSGSSSNRDVGRKQVAEGSLHKEDNTRGGRRRVETHIIHECHGLEGLLPGLRRLHQTGIQRGALASGSSPTTQSTELNGAAQLTLVRMAISDSWCNNDFSTCMFFTHIELGFFTASQVMCVA